MKATVVKTAPEPVKPSIKLTLELTPREALVLYTLGNWNSHMAVTLSQRDKCVAEDEASDVFYSLYAALRAYI